MYQFGRWEVAFILIYVAAIACVGVGAFTKRFDLRETVGTLILAVAVPVLGSLAVALMLISKLWTTGRGAGPVSDPSAR